VILILCLYTTKPPSADPNISQFSIARAHLNSSMSSLPTWEPHSKLAPLETLDPSTSWIEGYPSLTHAKWSLGLWCLQNTTCLVNLEKKTFAYTNQPTSPTRLANHPSFQPQIAVFSPESVSSQFFTCFLKFILHF